MGTNYIAPIWRMPRNANKDKLSNYSIDFDGGTSSEAIDCGNSSDVNITGPITISAWFTATTVGNARGVVCKCDNTASQSFAQYFFDLLNGEIRFRAGRTTLTHAINADQWYHAVGTYDGSNVTLYIDGTQVATAAAATTSYSSAQNMFIGRRIGQSAGYFGGKISQVCIFDYALTDGTGGTTNQIEYLYNLNNPMAITGGEPVAYWPLGDNSNPNANRGFPNISVGADSVFDFIPHDYINLGDPDSLSFGDSVHDSPFTMSAWIKTTGNGDGIISKWGGNPAGYEWIFYIVGNKIRVALYDATTSNYQRKDGVTIVNTGEWVHVLTTYDGRGGNGTNTNTANQGIKIYINGIEESSYTDAFGGSYVAMHNTIRPVQIGTYNTTSSVGFDGEMANVQIWRTDLTAPEVLTVYNNGQPLMTGAQPQQSSLTAWYKLNQSANWEADTANNWQIPDNRSAYPQSFFFDSTINEYIRAPKQSFFDTGNKSVSVWVKPQSQHVGYVYDCRGTSTGAGFTLIGTNTAGIFRLYVQMNTLTKRIFTGYQPSLDIQYDKWTNVAWTFDESAETLKVYINGVFKYTLTTTATGTFNPANPLEIGRAYNVNGNDFDGNISNLMIWDEKLTDGNVSLNDVATGQIAEVYNNGVPLTTAIAADNLKGWYKLNNNEIWDGTNWSVKNQKYPANYESALKVTAIGGGITTASPIISNSTTHSTSWWVKYDSYRTREDLILLGQGLGYYLMYVQNSGLMGFRPTTASALTISPSSTYKAITNGNTGKWYNYVFIRNGGNIKLYENNVKVWDATMTAGTENTATNLIQGFANLQSYAGTSTNYSNFSFFDTAIGEDDVQTLYNNGTPLTDVSSLTAMNNLYKLDNLTSGLQDSVGSNNATAAGTVAKVNTFVSTEAGVSSGMTEQNLVNNNVSALNGESVGMNTTNLVQSNLTRKIPFSSYSTKFDGIEYYTDTGGGFLNGATTASVSVWIKMVTIPSSGLYQPAASSWSSTAGRQYLIRYRTGNGFEFYLGGPSGPSSASFVVARSTITAVANTWYNIVGTWDGSEAKIYVNGAFGGSETATSGSLNSTTAPNQIGRYSATNMDGYISNTAFWTDTVLNEDDILNIYNNGVTQDLNNFRVVPTNWLPLDESYTYFNGSVMVARDVIGGGELDGVNIVQSDMVGNAPGSDANGSGSNLTIADLKGDMYNSDKNAFSINMGDYASGVTNPADSGRSTEVPSV